MRGKLTVLIRRAAYILFYLLDRPLSLKKRKQIIVLCYHSIADDGWKYAVSFKDLKRQVNYLVKRFNVITLDDLKLYLEGQKDLSGPSIVLTFDDGYQDVLQTKDFFQKLGIKPTMFVLSERQDANRKELETVRPFLTREEILKMKKAGWSIGSHSATHANLSFLNQESLQKEIIGSKKTLEKELGFKVDYFSYPKGNYNSDVLAAVEKAGYSLAVTMNDSFISRSTHPHKIPRVGINGDHSYLEFKGSFSPGGIYMRGLSKRMLAKK